jgi:cell shape-determining protein MreC
VSWGVARECSNRWVCSICRPLCEDVGVTFAGVEEREKEIKAMQRERGELKQQMERLNRLKLMRDKERRQQERLEFQQQQDVPAGGNVFDL